MSNENENPAEATPEYPCAWMPLAVGALAIVGWDGYSYVDREGRTYWSGAAEPSEADAQDVLANPAPRQLAARKASLRLRAKQRRREVEEGGITLPNGTPIATDRESQAMIDGTLSLASLTSLGSQFRTKWKGEDGVFREVTQSDLIAAALAVGLHVQACFNREAEFCDAIAAAETTAELDIIAAEIEAFELAPSS